MIERLCRQAISSARRGSGPPPIPRAVDDGSRRVSDGINHRHLVCSEASAQKMDVRGCSADGAK